VHHPSLYRDHVSVSEIARLLKRCEQRVRQLADAGEWPVFRDPDGKRWIHMPSVRAWLLDRQIEELWTRKPGPKGPRRSVAPKPDAYTRQFEAATA